MQMPPMLGNTVRKNKSNPCSKGTWGQESFGRYCEVPVFSSDTE